MDDNLANNNDLPEKPQDTDRWGSPQNSGSDDSSRWHGELYSPESDQSSSQNADRIPETVVITEPTSGTTTPKKDDGFPVWAIVLIVLLVLSLCVLCPVILVLGGVISLFQGALILLPFI
jgi:hypothetical protein